MSKETLELGFVAPGPPGSPKIQALLARKVKCIVTSFRSHGKGEVSDFTCPLSLGIPAVSALWWRIILPVPLPFIMPATLKKHQTIVTWPSEIRLSS